MRLVAGLLVALVTACGGSQVTGPTPAELASHLPATLETATPRTGEPRPLKLRAYADPAVRTSATWKADLGDEIDYANQLLTPLLGVKLVLESAKDWDPGLPPATALPALVELDEGRDVAWVLGLVGADEQASKAFSELEAAEPLGHHLVMRVWADEPETAAVAATLPDLSEAQRAEVIGAHHRHKQTVVLLHALAASLGAVAEVDTESIQNPTYSPRAHGVGDRTRALLQLAIDARLTDVAPDVIAGSLLTAIEAAPWAGWIPADVGEVTAKLHATIDARASGKTAVGVPASAAAQFARIEELAKRQDLYNAGAELDNLLAAYPGNAAMHQLKCKLLLAGSGVPPTAPGITAPATRAACTRATELAPGDPEPHLLVGEALAGVGDLPGARAELELAAAKITNLPGGAPEAWHRIVAVYSAMGALTWSEEALLAAGLATDPAAADIAQKRARYGIPKGGPVPPAQEGALVAAIRGALDLVYASKFPEAEAALAAAAKQWPRAAGVAAARCDLGLRAGHVPEARTQCSKALALDPHDSWALYLAAVIALQDPSGASTRAGIAKLVAALAVDPDLQQAWRTLGKAYERGRNAAALAKLRVDYAAKFGQNLP